MKTSILSIALVALQTLNSADAVSYPLPENTWSILPARTGNANDPGIDEQNVFDTGCALDDYYNVAVRRGTVNKLAIVFEGGGLCYNSNTCMPGKIPFVNVNEPGESITCTKTDLRTSENFPSQVEQAASIFDQTANSNEFKDWNIVLLRFCSCDLMSGSATRSLTNYGDCTFLNFGCKKKDFHFKGGNNANMVFNWVYEHYNEAFGVNAAPSNVLTTGCSAGGYSAYLYFDKINKLFPNSKHTMFADSAGGSVKEEVINEALTTWNSAEGVQDQDMNVFISNVERDPATYTPQGLLVAMSNFAADKNPDSMMLAFNRHEDTIQNLFRCITEEGRVVNCVSEYQGNLEPNYQPELKAHAINQQKGRCNVRTYIGTGKSHCAIVQGSPFEDSNVGTFLTEDVGNTKPLHDLLVDAIEGRCIESSSSVASFDDIAFQKYCDTSNPCVTSTQARSGDVSDEETSKSLSENPIFVGALSGTAAGVFASLVVSFLVIRLNNKNNKSNVVASEDEPEIELSKSDPYSNARKGSMLMPVQDLELQSSNPSFSA